MVMATAMATAMASVMATAVGSFVAAATASAIATASAMAAAGATLGEILTAGEWRSLSYIRYVSEEIADAGQVLRTTLQHELDDEADD